MGTGSRKTDYKEENKKSIHIGSCQLQKASSKVFHVKNVEMILGDVNIPGVGSYSNSGSKWI